MFKNVNDAAISPHWAPGSTCAGTYGTMNEEARIVLLAVEPYPKYPTGT